MPDNLSREVYGVLGIPIDAVDISGVLHNIEEASTAGSPYLISTPNLNFLVSSQTDADFRESLLVSDLCPVDGVPIVWIARLLGIPIKRRVAGSDIFEALKSRGNLSRPSKIFLFGGPQGVAQSASDALNAVLDGVVCVGSFYPGFCSVEEMSSDEILRTINTSKADFLILSLGAKKGQSWLLHNHQRLQIPVRSHLGAAINFQAGTLKRAPLFVRRFGFEWLWRIKEEPHLWSRYRNDGIVLLRLMLTCVLPLIISTLRLRLFGVLSSGDLNVQASNENGRSTVILTGTATAPNVGRAILVFREALANKKDLWIDISGVRLLDARFFGLFLMVWKQLKEHGARPHFTGMSTYAKRAFKLHGFEFLLREGA
jgi:N-acetylglucosaminyldiphosphoundecaprenol N-acetyl-beta-D-mannosaminyltransferase